MPVEESVKKSFRVNYQDQGMLVKAGKEEKRGTSFELPNGHPYKLKIRVGVNNVTDFFCDCDCSDDEKIQNWKSFIEYMTTKAPDKDSWRKEDGQSKPRLERDRPLANEKQIRQHCEAFYSLFVRFDDFLVLSKRKQILD